MDSSLQEQIIFGLTLRGQDLFCQKEYEVTLRSPTKL